ncbi:hypothetical protein [Aliarcobacter butzleri]|uniref:hypothetical protein n=1 Tax=Aliarcobacter butzleri TaxID=28197 RepID=UPI0021B47E9F|nr:hypothetical protein [Aliarcobacter butzleri]MCT7596712.1 hypothetical protein [Aliarcobacter butzleri]
MNYVNIDIKNKTKIVAKKEVVENLRTNEAIRNYIISSVSEIFKDKEILKKQKVVAIKNLAKDLKIALKNEAFNYSINLVIRNLNEYHNLQKSEIKDENGKVKNFIPTQEAQAIIQALVLLAYSNSLAKICKNLFKDKKGA